MTRGMRWGVLVVIGVSACALACTKDGGAGDSPRPTTTTTATATAKGAPRPAPDAGPCAADSDCTIWMDDCDCLCHAIAGKPPTRTPGACTPRNCGAAYPCMNMKAVCDPATKVCRATR